MKENTLTSKFQKFKGLSTNSMLKIKGGDDKRPDRPPGGQLPGGGSTLPNCGYQLGLPGKSEE